MKLKTHNMAHKQRTPFTLKSGNKTSFKAMGSSPMRLSRTPNAEEMQAMQRQATATPISQQYDGTKPLASKPQKPQLSPEMMKAQEEIRSKMIADGSRSYAQMRAAQARDGGPGQARIDEITSKIKAVQQGPNTIMNAQAPAQANPVQAPQAANMKQRSRGDYENFERGLKGEESSNRSRYGQVRGLVNTNAQAPAQPNTPRVAVQSAPRPDLSGGPRQPMGGLGQPMGGPGFGGPGQLPPNKGRRKPGMGSGMGRARRATGLARRARRAAGQVRRVRRSRG
jgi:hypothetical protein